MIWLFRLAVVGISLTVSFASRADPLGDWTKWGGAIVVLEKPDHSRLGSGVIVSSNPVVVATCYHVISGQRRDQVQVVAPAISSMPLQVQAAYTGRKAEDLAFVRLLAGSWAPAATWPTSLLPTGDPVGESFANVSAFGFAYPPTYDHNGAAINIDQLENFTTFLGMPTIGPRVYDLGSGLPAYLFDSGGPIIQGDGTVVGLVAGSNTYQNGALRWFAIPAWGAMPSAADFTSEDAFESFSPYSQLVAAGAVATAESLRTLGGSLVSDLNPNAAACKEKLALWMVATPPLGLADQNECGQYYAAIKPLILQDRALARANTSTREISRQATTIEQGAGAEYLEALAAAGHASGASKVGPSYKDVCSSAQKAAGPVEGSTTTCKTPPAKWSNLTWDDLVSDAHLGATSAEMISRGDALPDSQLSHLMPLRDRLLSSAKTPVMDVAGTAADLTKANADVDSALGTSRDPSAVRRTVAESAVNGGRPASEALADALQAREGARSKLREEIKRLLGTYPPPVAAPAAAASTAPPAPAPAPRHTR